MKIINFLYAVIVFLGLGIIQILHELIEIRASVAVVFSVISIVALSAIAVLAYKNYLIEKSMDNLFFSIAYIFVLMIFGFVLSQGFGYALFTAYYFQFIKIAEVLIFFFGIFILRERFPVKKLVFGTIVVMAAIFIYFFLLLKVNLFIINTILLYCGLSYLYYGIENRALKGVFVEILQLKIIAELFSIAGEMPNLSFAYIGSYVFYIYSLIKIALYFDKSMNKAYFRDRYSRQRQIRGLINTSSDGIIVLSGYFIKTINKNAVSILGYREHSEVREKNFFSLFEGIKKEDLDEVLKAFPEERQIEFARYNEKTKKVMILGYEYNDDIVLVLRGNKMMSDDFYKILESSQDIVYLYDVENKKYRFMNKSVQNILGYSANEFYNDNKMAEKIVFQDDYNKYIEAFRMNLVSEEIELRYVSKDGKVKWLLETISKVNFEERDYYFGTAKEITDRKEKELELTEKNIHLEEQSVKKEMNMSVVAHEIRAPITAIIGFLENIIINKTELSNKIADMVYKIYSNSIRLKELVNNLLDMNKVNAEKFEPFRENISVLEIVKEVLLNNEMLMEIKKIKAFNNIGENVYAYVDEGIFYQILTNILSNSIKYNKSEGRIYLDSEEVGENTIIKISDTGMGIKAEDKEKVFKEYERAKGLKEKGTGIGLPLTKKLVELNDGSIWFESEEGKGTTFFIEFPKSKTFVKEEKKYHLIDA